jgi:hypothetical protein
MNTQNAKIKVSFYLKRNIFRDGMNPVMGRITVGDERVQFSCKLDANPSLWDGRAGRMKGKSHHAMNVNNQIDKINVAVNARFKEILSAKGQATASEVKNAFSGNASAQETILKVFYEHKCQYRNLSGDELERLMYTKIKKPKLCFVRDMFVFSCFTGLAYADMCHLSEKHLRKTPDGNLWLDIPRQKTGVTCHIKLLKIPEKIMTKYRLERKSDKLFNMPSNALIFYRLRQLEELCGIEHLHFHMARHTFATLICLTNGVPMETISKMLGHSDMRSTQVYAEIKNQKVSDDMKKVDNRLKGKYKVN